MLDCTSFPLHVTIHVIDRVSSAIGRSYKSCADRNIATYTIEHPVEPHMYRAREFWQVDEPLANGRLAKEKIAELALKDEQLAGTKDELGRHLEYDKGTESCVN